MASFSVGNNVTVRGASTPVMVVTGVDNVLGNISLAWAVAGVIQTALMPQENLQIAGVNPPVNIAAPVNPQKDPWLPGYF
jgi:uncharacterized protein YodC (DUF2158 family)